MLLYVVTYRIGGSDTLKIVERRGTPSLGRGRGRGGIPRRPNAPDSINELVIEKFIAQKVKSVQFLEKRRHIVSLKTLLCLGLGLELGLGLAEIRFNQTCFRVSVVDPK